MKKLILLSLCLISLKSESQTFTDFYQTENPAFSNYTFRDVAVLSSGDLLVSCEYVDFGVYWMTALIKLTAEGDIIWAKQFPNSITATGRVLTTVENEAGNYLQLSLYWEYEEPHEQARLIEVSTDGEILWSKELDLGIPPDFSNFCYGRMEIMEDGELQLVIGAPADLLLMRTSSAGELIWSKTTPRVSMSVVDFSGMDWINLSSGDQLYSYKETDASLNLMRLNSAGDEVWAMNYTIGENPIPKALVELSDGHLLLAGYTLDETSFLIKIDSSDGSIIWGKELLDYEQAEGSKMGLASYGEYVLLTLSGNEKFRFAKLTEDGELLIAKQLPDANPIFEFATIHPYGDEDFLLGTWRDADTYFAFLERTNSVFEMSCFSLISSLSIGVYDDYSSSSYSPVFEDFTAITAVTYTFDDLLIEDPLVCISGGIDDPLFAEDDILLFPNPTTGMINIPVLESLSMNAFQVLNTSGQVLLEGKLTNDQNQIDLEGLENGIYFIRFISESTTRQFTIEILH